MNIWINELSLKKKILFILLVTLLIVILIIVSFTNSLKEYGSHGQYSNSILESKENGLFIDQYKIEPDTFIYQNDRIEFSQAWTEYCSHTEYKLLFSKKILIDKEKQRLLMEIKRTPVDKNLSLDTANSIQRPVFTLNEIAGGHLCPFYNEKKICAFIIHENEISIDTLRLNILSHSKSLHDSLVYVIKQ